MLEDCRNEGGRKIGSQSLPRSYNTLFILLIIEYVSFYETFPFIKVELYKYIVGLMM